MNLSHQLINNIFILAVEGEIDANSSLQLDRYVRNALDKGYHNILVDCEKLTYISSAGLGVFISYIDELQNQKGAFSFCKLQSHVFDVFKLLGLSKLVHISDSEKESVDYLLTC